MRLATLILLIPLLLCGIWIAESDLLVFVGRFNTDESAWAYAWRRGQTAIVLTPVIVMLLVNMPRTQAGAGVKRALVVVAAAFATLLAMWSVTAALQLLIGVGKGVKDLEPLAGIVAFPFLAALGGVAGALVWEGAAPLPAGERRLIFKRAALCGYAAGAVWSAGLAAAMLVMATTDAARNAAAWAGLPAAVLLGVLAAAALGARWGERATVETIVRLLIGHLLVALGITIHAGFIDAAALSYSGWGGVIAVLGWPLMVPAGLCAWLGLWIARGGRLRPIGLGGAVASPA